MKGFRKAEAIEMDPVDVAWLAGLLEGEGSFMRLKRQGGRPDHGRVSVFMTDRDVLERVVAITGCGNVRQVVNRGNLGSKPIFCWMTSRLRDVETICLAVRPFMGVRRTAAIDSVLSLCEERFAAA